jgi:hypothetical protein
MLVASILKEDEMSERIDSPPIPPVEVPGCEPPTAVEPQTLEQEDEALIEIAWTTERARIRAAAKAYLEGSYADD